MGLNVDSSKDWFPKFFSSSLRKRNRRIENPTVYLHPGVIKTISIKEDLTNHDFGINSVLFEHDAQHRGT